MMKVTRLCPFTHVRKTRELDITDEEALSYMNREKLIQDAFPRLNAEEREFVKTGVDGETWNRFVGGGDE